MELGIGFDVALQVELRIGCDITLQVELRIGCDVTLQVELRIGCDDALKMSPRRTPATLGGRSAISQKLGNNCLVTIIFVF